MAGQVVQVHHAVVKQLREHLKRNDFNYLAFPDVSVQTNKIEVWPAPASYIDYWMTFTGSGIKAVNLRLRIQTTMGSAITAGELIAELVSAGDGAEWSVWDALLADKTLGGVAEETHWTGDVEYDVDDQTYAHVIWMPFTVVLRKSGARA